MLRKELTGSWEDGREVSCTRPTPSGCISHHQAQSQGVAREVCLSFSHMQAGDSRVPSPQNLPGLPLIVTPPPRPAAIHVLQFGNFAISRSAESHSM